MGRREMVLAALCESVILIGGGDDNFDQNE